jgi:hypothetical protein
MEDPMSPWIAATQAALGEALLASGDTAAAEVMAGRAARIAATHADLGAQFRGPIRALAAAVRAAPKPRTAANRDAS